MNKIFVKFLFSNKEITVPKGRKLSEICAENGYAQDLVCGGNGKCGKCGVEIIVDGKESTVLSCHYEVQQDIEIKRISNLSSRKVNVLTSNSRLDCEFNPSLEFLNVHKDDIKADHCSNVQQKVYDKYKLKFSLNSAIKLSYEYFKLKDDQELCFVIYKDEIIDVLVGNQEKNILGMAIDIGSTTCAAYIYDMKNFKMLGAVSSLNMQTELGADVISRIGFCVGKSAEDGVEVLRKKVSDTINMLLNDAKALGIDTESIYHLVLCGNSTMQHLFLGIYPEALGKGPFISMTHDFIECTQRDTLLNLNKNARITFLPLLGGFVGADTTAVLISTPDDNKPRLVIDLGTNGEIAMGSAGKYLIASTACGPALEGAGLCYGMRAADGAIEHFQINEDNSIDIQVIGKCRAKGICGSGIIDILAELLRHNVINKRGKMYSKDEYEKKYGENALSARLQKIDDKNAFIIEQEDESGGIVAFTQMDVREIQKAKAAIAAGCKILVRNYGIKESEVHEICLAGAFGNYLDVEQAQYVGLFPKFEGVPVRSIGNGAGSGVQMYLLDKASVELCQNIQKNVDHIELNFEDGFMDLYMSEMEFVNAGK